jgi:hypothetical protein
MPGEVGGQLGKRQGEHQERFEVERVDRHGLGRRVARVRAVRSAIP